MFSIEQYHAVRNAAGLIDRSARGRIGVGGKDRASYLQGLLTNDVVALKPGTGCYAAYLTPQGRMIADMRVLALEAELLLDVNPEQKEMLLRRLDQFIFTEEVRLRDLTAAWTALGVHGPQSASVVEAAWPEVGASLGLDRFLRDLPEDHHVTVGAGESSVVIVAARHFGESGFDLYVAREREDWLRERLHAAGAPAVSSETAEVLRVEAGRPKFGADMDEETLPLEAGIEDRAISLTKGCYVGQEVIIRVLHRGHGRVVRRLVGLTIEPGGEGESVLVAAGDTVEAGDRAVGRVTSAVWSPAVGKPIALAYVHRDFIQPGTEVIVRHEGRALAAKVTQLPFVTN